MSRKITREEVRHVALLSRLSLDESEEAHFTEQLDRILEYMDKLGELDTREVPPTTHSVPMQNVFKDDEVRPSLDREQVLRNAPRSDGVSFIVPKVF